MEGKLNQIFLYSLFYSVMTVSCCPRKPSPALVIAQAELTFPGATDLTVEASFNNTGEIISKWRHNLKGSANLLAKGELVAHISNATSVMLDLLSSAKSEGGNLTEPHRALTALRVIESKLGTLRYRLKEVKRCIEQGRSFDVSIRMAAQQCEQIFQTFSNRENFLLNEANILFTAPSFMAFVGVYAGVAGFQFQVVPSERPSMVNEMKALKVCMEDYRDATLAKRLSYVDPRPGEETFCRDLFNEITPCKSCPDLYSCHGNHVMDLFTNYKSSLGQIYQGYFDGPLEELEQLSKTLEQNISS